MQLSVDFAVIILMTNYITVTLTEQLVYSTTGVIGAENYTYIKLTGRSAFRIELISLKGDADLYVSDKTLSPDYINYELQSVTCGKDVIHIPVELNRPVGIGIYGHSSHDESTFRLLVYEEDGVDIQGYDDYTEQNQGASSHTKKTLHKEEEAESLVWTIFVGILKILFDILV